MLPEEMLLTMTTLNTHTDCVHLISDQQRELQNKTVTAPSLNFQAFNTDTPQMKRFLNLLYLFHENIC